jgi:hypothetical protein
MNLNKLGTYLLGGTVALLLMAANAAAQPVPITIVVNTVGADGTFAFTGNFGDSPSVTTMGGTGQVILQVPYSSGYSLFEIVPAGWTLTSNGCTGGTVASFTPPSTCTYNNTFVPVTGSITVVTNAVNGNGTFPITNNFGAVSPQTTVGGTVTQTITGITPGTYSVSETLPAGWTQTSAICNNSSTIAAITVTAGVTTTCTFTNTIPPGSITVVKNTVGAAESTFTFTDNFGVMGITTSGNTGSQTIPNLVVGGSYYISEPVVPGWTQTSATCTNGSPSAIGVLSGVKTI